VIGLRGWLIPVSLARHGCFGGTHVYDETGRMVVSMRGKIGFSDSVLRV
jgi:hypothetical protein